MAPWFLFPALLLGLSTFHLSLTTDTCQYCYYKIAGQQNAYQVNTCSDCGASRGKGKNGPLPYPADSKIKPCAQNPTSSTVSCTAPCSLPGGPCNSDGDCCAYPSVTKIYPKGIFSTAPGDYRKLNKNSGTKCVFGSCRIDACKADGATCSKQQCYIQDPSVSQFNYVVYRLSTCGFCIPAFTGARTDASSPIKTGILSKDGLVLRNQNGKCVYCSVLHGKCVNDSDCCEPGSDYTGSIGKVYTSVTLESTLRSFKVDKVKCLDGKCAFDSCFTVHDTCVVGSGKPCCDESANCIDGNDHCTRTQQLPADCPNKKYLNNCPGYQGTNYCNCTKAATPEICLPNGECKPCAVLGKACKTNDECCKYPGDPKTVETCVKSICTKCFPLGKTDCHDYNCCYGTCKTFGAGDGDAANIAYERCAL